MPVGRLIHDPGFGALRRAARAAIVIPLALAFAKYVLKDPNALLFVVFGSFALLVMSDFGGLRRARARAYLTAALVGAGLIILGTFASATAWLAAGTMFVVAFVMNFARIFGGYIAVGEVGLLLSFVIALSIPAPPSSIPGRLAGWAVAAVCSTLAATLLWPRFERVTVRKSAAHAVLALAQAIDALGSKGSSEQLKQRIAGARKAQQDAALQFRSAVNRPVGPARRDRALIELLSEVDRIVDILEHPFHQTRPERFPQLPEGASLTATVVGTLRAAADVLTGGSPPDLAAIDRARDAHREALDRWAAAQLRHGRPADEVLEGIDADHTLRTIAYLTMALASNASIAGGYEPRGISLPSAVPARPGIDGVLLRISRTVRTHLDPTSTVLHGTLRVAFGLTIAVLLARLLDLSHAFWVVLGALQVLRSNALGTGRTTVQAIIGNAIGVLVGGLFVVVAGKTSLVMWLSLPVTVFIAAYAASTIGFMASQAAFTINLIVIFNLLAPAGWQIGLLRLEDLGVGVGISLLVGLLLWPSGARREFARSVADLYRTMTPQVGQAFRDILGLRSASPAGVSMRTVIAARDRAGEALQALMNERSASTLDTQTAGLLVSAGNHVILAAELLEMVARRMDYRAQACPDGVRRVEQQTDAVLGEFVHLADQLSRAPSMDEVSPRPSLDAVREAELDCLRRWRNDDQAGRSAIALVIAGEWLANLDRLEEALQRPVALVADAARTPWWR